MKYTFKVRFMSYYFHRIMKPGYKEKFISQKLIRDIAEEQKRITLLCNDEGCPELAKYMCRLDYVIADIIGMKLKRTKTLAEGGDFCDFRYSRRQIKSKQ